MTVMAEETTLTEGTRVRITHGPDLGTLGTYQRPCSCGGCGGHIIDLDDGRDGRLFDQPHFEVVSPNPAITVGSREFRPGDRVVVAPLETLIERAQPIGLRVGNWPRENTGRTGVVVTDSPGVYERDVLNVRFGPDPGGAGTDRACYRFWLDHTDAGATDSPVVRDPDAFVVGTRFRVATQEDSDARNCSNAGWPRRQAGNTGVITAEEHTGEGERRIVRIQLDNGPSAVCYVGNLEPEATGTTPPPAATPPAVVNPIPLGTRVLYGSTRGVVIDKADSRVPRAYVTSDSGYLTSDRYAAVLFDGNDVANMAVVTQVQVIPDTSGLSVEQQLERLQRLIHRVASYEAVRRDWCGEVNGALAPLDLPDHLSTVDRDLGRALQGRPDQLLVLDGPIQSSRTPGTRPDDDDDEDEDTSGSADYTLYIDVDSYDAAGGFIVSGARVSVSITTEWDDESEHPGDPDTFAWSDYVDDEMVIQAIRNDGDLPNPDYYGSVSWTESGTWDEN